MTKPSSIGEWIELAYREEPGCPPPEAFLPAERAALEREARERLDRHAESCAACAAERDLAQVFELPESLDARSIRDLENMARQLRRRAPYPRAHRWFGWLSSWSSAARAPALQLAAVAVLVVGAALVLRNGPEPPAIPDRTGEDVMRSSVLEPLAPVGEISEPPTLFAWEGVDAAASYLVIVRGVDDDEIWRGETEAPSMEIGTELAVELRRAVAYVWTVEALDASGTRIAWSTATRFRILPGER